MEKKREVKKKGRGRSIIIIIITRKRKSRSIRGYQEKGYCNGKKTLKKQNKKENKCQMIDAQNMPEKRHVVAVDNNTKTASSSYHGFNRRATSLSKK